LAGDFKKAPNFRDEFDYLVQEIKTFIVKKPNVAESGLEKRLYRSNL